MNKSIPLIFIFFLGSNLSFSCDQFKTRYVFNKKTIITLEQICFDENRPQSINCSPYFNKKCPFSKMDKKLSVKQFVSSIGSPGFGLCHALGGSPQIYEIEMAGEWKSYDRCFGNDGKEFVDIDTLIKHHL